MTNHIFVAALVMIACSGTGLAAEQIRYGEIPDRIAPYGTVLEHRDFRVTTLDAKVYSSRKLVISSDRVQILRDGGVGEVLPGDEVSRIEIRQTGRFRHKMLVGALL